MNEKRLTEVEDKALKELISLVGMISNLYNKMENVPEEISYEDAKSMYDKMLGYLERLINLRDSGNLPHDGRLLVLIEKKHDKYYQLISNYYMKHLYATEKKANASKKRS